MAKCGHRNFGHTLIKVTGKLCQFDGLVLVLITLGQSLEQGIGEDTVPLIPFKCRRIIC